MATMHNFINWFYLSEALLEELYFIPPVELQKVYGVLIMVVEGAA